MAARLEQEAALGSSALQMVLFPKVKQPAAPVIRSRGRGRGRRASVQVSDESLLAAREATTLEADDQVRLRRRERRAGSDYSRS